MSDKNKTQLYRNPNSPEAIEARLQGLQDPTPFQEKLIIDDKRAGLIEVDKTKSFVDQRLSLSKSGKNLSKQLIRASIGRDENGNQISTLYYFDSYRLQWLVVKDYINRPLSTDPTVYSEAPWPRATYGSTYGNFGQSAPGENWRNQDRSMKDIEDAQRRVFKNVIVDQNAENDKKLPDEGQYDDDFTGTR